MVLTQLANMSASKLCVMGVQLQLLTLVRETRERQIVMGADVPWSLFKVNEIFDELFVKMIDKNYF